MQKFASASRRGLADADISFPAASDQCAVIIRSAQSGEAASETGIAASNIIAVSTAISFFHVLISFICIFRPSGFFQCDNGILLPFRRGVNQACVSEGVAFAVVECENMFQTIERIHGNFCSLKGGFFNVSLWMDPAFIPFRR